MYIPVCHWYPFRPRKTKIGIEIAHVTRDLETTFKVKRSKVKVTGPLYSASLLCQNEWTYRHIFDTLVGASF